VACSPGTALHYARYRPGYPPAFLDDLIQRLGLDGTGRLLDLGCGTGQLTLPLAAHVAEAVGMDPESEMLTEAIRQAREQAIANVSWIQGDSAHLPRDLGHFTLVTMGRSFHWMDREQVLTALDEMVDDEASRPSRRSGATSYRRTNTARHRRPISARHMSKYWSIHPSGR
jgi:2-polyprenyl-3-methyl-5-hydroxy-6-metoxy-1,4-benzoquinol methylase